MNKEQVTRKPEERKTLGIGSIPVTIMIHDGRFNFLYSQCLISVSASTGTSEPVLAP
jgi:hypothetical protein